MKRSHGMRSTPTRWQVRSVGGAVALLVALGAGLQGQDSYGACPGVCGDGNGSGTVTSSDVIVLTDFLYNGGPPATVADCLDVDQYELTTVRDLQWMLNSVFKGGPAPDCALLPPLVPTVNAVCKIKYDPVYPPGLALHSVQISVVVTDAFVHLDLPVAFTVDGGPPVAFGPVVLAGALPAGFEVAPAGAPANSILFRVSDNGNIIAPGMYNLATVDLFMVPSPSPRLVRISRIGMPPLQGGVPVHYAMLLDPALDASRPGLCPNVTPGDVDGSGAPTAGDIVVMVNYIFKGAMPPPILAAGDVNCSGTFTSADIISLVQHVFKGGVLCDLCV